MEEIDDHRVLARIVRQRLESLRRSGVDRLPVAVSLPASMPRRAAAPVAPPPVRASIPVAPPTTPAFERPTPAFERPTPMPTPARPAPVAPSGPPATAASLFGEPEMGEAVPESERASKLLALADEVSRCTRCAELSATRNQTVFGEGSPTARLMFIGEAPGAEEDRTGRPFVGPAGQLLTDMITKGMGLGRDEVFIANILKSRPPGNRDPRPEEIQNCLGYLERQIEIVRPQFLCLLGKIAALSVLETGLPLSRLRGKWHRYRSIPTIVTYHPSYLLRTPTAKKDAWADLQILMQAMGIKPPERRKPADG